MYIFLLVISLPIIYFVIKFVQSSTPKGFAHELAKAQLLSLRTFKEKYPEEFDKEKQYKATLMLRPGYTEEKVSRIILHAKEACQEVDITFNFQVVVIQLAADEYMQRTGNSPFGVMTEINSGVSSVIPLDL